MVFFVTYEGEVTMTRTFDQANSDFKNDKIREEARRRADMLEGT